MTRNPGNDSGSNKFSDRLRAEDRSLWADKYEARHFVDLVTEDYVNREAVLWLKSWDVTVFGQVARVNFSTIANQRKEGRKDVLMISGPPGCGKTTLAKVAALHCGYLPFLIDCTIESSAANLLQKVTNAMSIQSIDEGQRSAQRSDQPWKPKPLCVILDQVESLDKATIGQLETLIRKPLKRPIIVIVSDFYAMVLKNLKPHCQMLQCKLNPATRLQARLAEVTRKEGLRIESSALLYLLTHSNNDIRCCLNSLQMLFISKPPDSYISLEEVKNCIGKDLRLSAFDLWKAIFTKQDLREMEKMVLDNGEFELVNQGIYENFVNVSSADYDFHHTSLLLDFLSLDDTVSLRTKEKQQFELIPLHTLPSRLANHCFNATFSEMHFPVLGNHISKAVTEGWETVRELELQMTRKAGKIAVQTALEEVWPYVYSMINPVLAENGELGLSHWEIYHDLGFTVVNKASEPALHRVIRLPAGAMLRQNVLAWYEKMQNMPKTHVKTTMEVCKEIQIPKRKRQNREGVSVWYKYHEGLTNAVKRKVRISDLLSL